MLLLASLAVIVRLSAAPAVGVTLAASSTRWVVGPNATVADLAVLVAVQVRHTAVTVYACVPIGTPVSVQLVAVEGEPELGQPPPGEPPSRVTKYSTVPPPGGVTADHVSSTVPAPGVAVEIVGEGSVARFADAFASPGVDQYATAPEASRLSAVTVVTAIRRGLLRRFGLMSTRWMWRAT